MSVSSEGFFTASLRVLCSGSPHAIAFGFFLLGYSHSSTKSWSNSCLGGSCVYLLALDVGLGFLCVGGGGR